MSGPRRQRAVEARHGYAGAQRASGGLQAMSGPPDGNAAVEAHLGYAGAQRASGGLQAMSGPPDGSALSRRATATPGRNERLQQVVWSLLMNAVKFTPKEGRVQVQLKRVDSHVEIVITDTGEGISPEMLPTIFDRFQQAHAGTAQRQSGLGLGLTLVRFLVEAHGGSVTADSLGQGQGATFVITLPLPQAKVEAQVDEYLPTTAGVAQSSYPNPTLEGLRVLVVDDEPDALDLATAILTTAGAEVRSCQSSAEALAICQHWAPDVLISDIEMPGEDARSRSSTRP